MPRKYNSSRNGERAVRLDGELAFIAKHGPCDMVQIIAAFSSREPGTTRGDIQELVKTKRLIRLRKHKAPLLYAMPEYQCNDSDYARMDKVHAIEEEELAPGHRRITHNEGWKPYRDGTIANAAFTGSSSICGAAMHLGARR
jgi:hypothetical protein